MSDDAKKLFDFPKRERSSFESLLKKFVEIPTVSAETERKPDIKRAADLAVETIRQFGGKAEILKGEGNPIVHGRFDVGAKAPTVTMYNHLDVQPAERERDGWNTEPFEFVKQGDRYFGRGTTDDKGPALTALFGIRNALESGVNTNMHVLWEFEEEIGSENFEKTIAASAKRIATDSVLVSDTIWVARNRPAAPSGLRGFQGFTLALETGTTDNHSGTTGGAARNPLGELMKLVSQMYDAGNGRVKIKGFYDDVVPPTREELADFRNSGFSLRQFKKDNGLKSLRSDDAVDVMRRIWAMPTFEVHGVIGGYTGPGIKTIIPPRAEVKFSCRLVPNQSPARVVKLVRAFVREHNPDVKVIAEGNMLAYKAPTTGVYADAVKRSMKFAFGKEPVFVREGGSIGAVVSMEKVLHCPVLFLGLSLPEHGYHAPNENYDWQQASGGMVAFARYFQEIAAIEAQR